MRDVKVFNAAIGDMSVTMVELKDRYNPLISEERPERALMGDMSFIGLALILKFDF